MAVLARKEKQPYDELYYTVGYQKWLRADETITDVTAVAETIAGDASPLVVGSAVVLADAKTIAVTLSGGTAGLVYEVTLRIETTNPAEKKEDELVVRVVEV